MGSNIYMIYDDSNMPSEDIKSVIGNLHFGDAVYKRVSLKDRMTQFLKKIDFVTEIFHIKNQEDIEELILNLGSIAEDLKICHIYSHSLIFNKESFEILLQKARYANESFIIREQVPMMMIFSNVRSYIDFLKSSRIMTSTINIPESLEIVELENYQALMEISSHSRFIAYLSGGFDARFFNSLSGDEFTVTKSSTNKNKIKAEYTFYHLLPDEMKSWFVLPYNYNEDEKCSRYTMERYNTTDIAIQWVHGSIDILTFEKLMKKIFYFSNNRSRKIIDKVGYDEIAYDLYVKKLEKRMNELKEHNLFPTFSNLISSGTQYGSIDEIMNEYIGLYRETICKYDFQLFSVIGHGDLCFSNMLYNKETSLLKLIDPKGALEEKDLWTNPYYDIAKLSHSICGRYDLFNNSMYTIEYNEEMQFQLNIEFDHSEYIRIFKKYLKEYGYHYECVRLFEASLFLSMLPLHMDYPQKVFGFLLNAINILNEVKLCLKS
jgi:hypothetical protein